MEKFVTAGMKDCSIDLDGTECLVQFSAPYKAFSLQNNSDDDVIISIYSGKTKTDDGVRIVPAGESRIYAVMHNIDTVYVTGEGNVELTAQNEVVNPFKSSAKGGDPDNILTVTKKGNPVILNDLQGGAPFNEITVSGKNLFVPVVGYALYGGTTSGFRLRETDNAFSHVAKIRNNTDYTLKSHSDGNRMNVILFKNDPYTLAKDDDFKRLLWQITPPFETKEITFNSENYNYVVLSIASGDPNIDTIIKDAQLEYGTEPTAYVPPIVGREMVLNVNGTDYSITPDTNPYTVPVDITQVDGENVISIADNSQPIISVNGNKKSKQLEMLMRQEINMLYEGTATEDVPAIVDMSRFKQYHISAMYMDANYNYLAETTISADELEIILENGNPVNIAMSSVSVINLYFAGEKDAVIFYGKASGTSQQYRFEIFGTD